MVPHIGALSPQRNINTFYLPSDMSQEQIDPISPRMPNGVGGGES